MKITHRVPMFAPRSATVDPAYQREVDRDTARGEAKYREAQRRVDQAEARLAKVQSRRRTPSLARQIREASALVELRRSELQSLHAAMTASPASAAHRGVRSHRPVPLPGDLP